MPNVNEGSAKNLNPLRSAWRVVQAPDLPDGLHHGDVCEVEPAAAEQDHRSTSVRSEQFLEALSIDCPNPLLLSALGHPDEAEAMAEYEMGQIDNV
jgi:hypothetical protein